MIRKILVTGIILINFHLLFAQVYYYKNFKWQDKPQRVKLTIQEDSQSYVVLKEKISFEYLYDEKGDMIVYRFYHKIIRLNNNAAIESFNKVYISMDDAIDLIDIHARAITKEGKITEFDKSNIKEIKNLEDKGDYKMFAIEGLEKGCDLEYYYIQKKYPNYCACGRYIFQEDAITKNAYFEIISPRNIFFMAKGYNGFTQPASDTLANGRNIIKSGMDSVPALNEEVYSLYSNNLMRVEYKLRNNLFTQKSEAMTWSDFARHSWDYIYEKDEKSDKQIQKLLGNIKMKGLDDQDKIRIIEVYLKTKFFIKEDPSAKDLGDLQFILKNGYTNETGMLRLYMRFFREAGIECEAGCTTDRFVTKLDKDFMSWNYLEKYLIYFPKYDNFIAPAEIDSRYGMLPWKWVNNFGVFVKPVVVGDFETGVPVIRYIPPMPFEKTYSNIKIQLSFIEDFSQSLISAEYDFGGYLSLQPVWDLIDEKQQTEYIESTLKQFGENTTIINSEVLNKEVDIDPLKTPFIIKGQIKATSLIEKAGDKFLFKIGDLIGKQVEMYNEKTRRAEIETEYPHHYLREISFTIPDGYVVEGLEKLKINISHLNDSIGFNSDYIMTGNTVKVTIKEFYKKVQFPVSAINDFREVINAAADFNKITLVIKKKD